MQENNISMDLKEYQKNAKRTCASLGDYKLDLAHMVLGIVSEQEEYLKALVLEDEVNQREELADICWYVANYCELRGYSFYIILKASEDYFEPEEDWVKKTSYLDVYTSKLVDYVKKYIAYDKKIDNLKELEALGGILYSITLEECYFNFERDLALNIEKLKARFPKKFTTEKALNRNLDKEREILES